MVKKLMVCMAVGGSLLTPLSAASAVAPVAPAAAQAGQEVDVQVGMDGRDRFSPEMITASPGDTVTFHFHRSADGVAESTSRLSDPCHSLGGFDSGTRGEGDNFSIIVSTHNAVYIHNPSACGKGMVAIINPGPNDSVETFRQAAVAQEG
ncbi:hypothetical protein [Streptomyces sp. NBC_01590]